jgi:hypothetical protein
MRCGKIGERDLNGKGTAVRTGKERAKEYIAALSCSIRALATSHQNVRIGVMERNEQREQLRKVQTPPRAWPRWDSR